MIEITPERFYKTGIACFLIIGLFNLANFAANFGHYNFYGKVSTTASIIFNFTLVGFFFFLYKQGKGITEEVDTSAELEKVIAELHRKPRGKK
jgi:hypothetical protein